MWTREIFGFDVLHLMLAFILYSMLGWLVESIYMSFCNKKLTNRGFARSPFCPIYGFGGVIGYLILRPLADNKIILYVVGAIVATAFEFLVAKLMQKTIGEVYWDYSEKPLNYQGFICVESTIAWGAYAVIIVCYLQEAIIRTVEKIPPRIAITACQVILLVYTLDFTYHLLLALDINIREYMRKARDSYRAFRAKW